MLPSRAIERLPLLMGGGATLIGAGTFALWALAPHWAMTFGPGSAMLPNTALLLLLLGLAVMARHLAPGRMIHRGLALLVMGVATVMLAEHAFGWHLGLDTLLFGEPVRALGMLAPGRPAFSTLVSMELAGLAIALLGVRIRRGYPSEWLAIAGGVWPYITLLGYCYGVSGLFLESAVMRMALGTTIALCLVALGILLDPSNHGMMAYLAPESPGGIFLRRFLPPVLFLPPALGWLRIVATRLGYFDVATGTTLMVVATILIGIWLLGWCADSLNQLEGERRHAVAEMTRRDLALQQAQELANLKDGFLSTMSHELKTPLSLLTGYTELLEDKYPDEELLRGLREGSDRLTATIDHILDYSALVGGGFPLYCTVVDLSEVVQHARAIQEPELARRQITLDVSVDPLTPSVWADPRRVLQVIVELFGHLARFGQAGGHAHLTVHPCAQGACLELAEAGWKLTDPTLGAQAPLMSGQTGLQLALPIVSKLVELHGGTLAFRQDTDEAACVSLSLPPASAESRPAASRA